MIPHNPTPIIKYFPHLCSAFVQYKNDGASEELLKMFRAVLLSFKLIINQGGVGGGGQSQQWDEFIGDFPMDLKNEVNNFFNLI